MGDGNGEKLKGKKWHVRQWKLKALAGFYFSLSDWCPGKTKQARPNNKGGGALWQGGQGPGEGRGGGGEEGESALGPIQYRICISRFDSTNPRGVFGSPGSRKRTLK